MNISILNREFQHPTDGWYQIEAKGEHPNRKADVLQIIDGTSADSICNRFNEAAKAGKLRHGNEMLIDHEHFSDNPDKETRAYGWLTELQNRDDGIYGKIRWSSTGKAAVDGGDYRFFSTEYCGALENVDRSQVVNRNLKGEPIRPLELTGLTLTNMNNNRGQKPITNREGETKIHNGDVPGHEFHGNQYQQAASIASNHAAKSSEAAFRNMTEGAHRQAARMHSTAKNSHSAAYNKEQAAYHDKISKQHTVWADNLKSPASLHNKDFPGASASAAVKPKPTNMKQETRTERILNGDFPGHPFRGNQYADGNESGAHNNASAKANSASKSAHEPMSHGNAAAAHAKAAKLHEGEGNHDVAAYHEAMAKYHQKRATFTASMKNRGELTPDENKQETMKDIATTLGLSEDAAPEAVSLEVAKLLNRASYLEAQNTALVEEQCDVLMTARGIKPDDSAKRDKLRPVLTGLKNREERESFLAECVSVTPTGSAPQKKLLNKDTNAKPSAEGSESDDALAKRIINRADELCKSNRGLTRGTAVLQAQRELTVK